MAVEIPVVVDIDQAFEDAAKRVPKAAKPLEEQVEQVNRRISSAIQKMQKAAVNPSVGAEELDKKMSKYANTVRLATLQMRKLGEAQGKLVSGRLDIQDISTRLVNLVNNWNSMKLGSKFDPDGKLRVKAQGIISQMSTLTGKTIKLTDEKPFKDNDFALELLRAYSKIENGKIFPVLDFYENIENENERKWLFRIEGTEIIFP